MAESTSRLVALGVTSANGAGNAESSDSENSDSERSSMLEQFRADFNLARKEFLHLKLAVAREEMLKYTELCQVVGNRSFFPSNLLCYSTRIEGHMGAFDKEHGMYRIFKKGDSMVAHTALSPVPATEFTYKYVKQQRDYQQSLIPFVPSMPPLAEVSSLTENLKFVRDKNSLREDYAIAIMRENVYLVFKSQLESRVNDHVQEMQRGGKKTRLAELSSKDLAMAAFLFYVFRPYEHQTCVLSAFAIQEYYGADKIDIHVGALLFSVQKTLSPKKKREVALALTGDPDGSADWDNEFGELDGTVSIRQ